MKVSVIVLTFNSEKYLPELVDSLNKTTVSAGTEVSFVYVDNASSDNTRETLKQVQGDILLQETNLGFTGGNNVGIKHAMNNNADYVILLNDDTVVTPHWIEELLAAAQEKPDAGEIQSLLLYWDDKNIVNSWGNYIHFLGIGFAGGNLQNRSTLKNKETAHEVTYASCTAAMFKVDALREVGLLDETYESYHEDTDISIRLKLAGYKIYLAPKSVVYHKYQFLKANKVLKGSYKYYLIERNRLYLILKHYSLKTLILISPAFIVMDGGIFLFSILRGFWKEKLRAYTWIVKNWSLVMNARKEMRKRRSITDKELMHDFVATVDYQEIQNLLLKYLGNPIINFYWKLIKSLL